MLIRPDGSVSYGKLRVDFFSNSEFLHPIMKIQPRLIGARPTFYMIRHNPNVSVGIVFCSLYTRRTALKDAYHMKQMDMLAYNSVEFTFVEILEKIFVSRAR